MKKFIFSLLALAVSFTATAQNAEEIYKTFVEKTGVEKFVADRDGRSSLVEAEIGVGPMVMNCKITAKYPSFYRVEMDVQDQNVLIVVRDTTAYVTAGGQTQTITGEESVRQVLPMIDAAKDMVPTIDLAKTDLKFIGTEGKGKKALNIIEAIDKEKKDGVDKSTLYFNVETGLLEKAEIDITPKEGKPLKIEQTFKNYTSYDDGALLLPSSFSTKMPEVTINITLKSFEADYPTANWMFAAPKK